MKSGICITNIWSDQDIVELKIEAWDGKCRFATTAYVGRGALKEMVEDLRVFTSHLHGGIFDIRLGEFGPEYAKGALLARLHFQPPGTLRVSVSAQSEFEEFGIKAVASDASLFFSSEPVMLDVFVDELSALFNNEGSSAELKGV